MDEMHHVQIRIHSIKTCSLHPYYILEKSDTESKVKLFISRVVDQ